MICGPQSGVDEPFSVISAVTPEPHVGSDIKILPRTLTLAAFGAVQDRATHEEDVEGGSSSKLLTKPEAVPPLVSLVHS
jgi:hypothetical protein